MFGGSFEGGVQGREDEVQSADDVLCVRRGGKEVLCRREGRAMMMSAECAAGA